MPENVTVERTHNYPRQIKGSVLYKGVAVSASFLAVPLITSYLEGGQFSIWSALLTIMSWVVFFDLVVNGLRNKVAESLAKDLPSEARSCTWSGYSLIASVAIGLCLSFAFLSYYFWLWDIFKAVLVAEGEFWCAVQVAITFMLVGFFGWLVAALLKCLQKSVLVSLGQLFTNIFVLLVVYLASLFLEGVISQFPWAYGVALLVGSVFLSLWFFENVNIWRRSLCYIEVTWRRYYRSGFGFYHSNSSSGGVCD